jgi:hypothetical protein
MNTKILRMLLLAGIAYFCCMALAHFFGFKVPVLFIYYDTPYYAYQDKIISFAVVAYICLFFTAQRSSQDVPPALVAIWVTVLGLSGINLSPALSSILDGKSTFPYWLQTGLLAIYALALSFFWLQSRKEAAS